MSFQATMKFAAAATLLAPVPALAKDDIKVTASAPIYVKHFKPFPSRRFDWNEGFLNNAGLIIDADIKIADLGKRTQLYAGPTVGFYNNSLNKNSHLYGGNVMADRDVGSGFRLNAGIHFGMLTGYAKPRPALSPFAGAEKELFNHVSLGIRAEWLPAETASKLFGFDKRKTSDVINGLVTVSLKL